VGHLQVSTRGIYLAAILSPCWSGQVDNRGHGREPTWNTIQTLGKDVSDQYQLLLSEDSQLLRRSFIRSFFAYVEGLTYVLKQHGLRHAKNHPEDYTTGEFAMLREENYSLSNKGTVSTQRKFLPTGENFLFAIAYLPKENTRCRAWY
jgi:hypothetical protein